MPIHVNREVEPTGVPEEFARSAVAYLDSAEKLNSLMADGQWSSNFHRGQAVLWLIFHAVELFLKACILRLDPAAKVSGHSLPWLSCASLSAAHGKGEKEQ